MIGSNPIASRPIGAQPVASSSGTTITCTVGAALAVGATALISQTIPTTVGNASALGITALANSSVVASVGDASALGVTAAVSTSSATTIIGTVGNAAASGTTALLNTTLQTGVGNAGALGVTAAVTQATGATITCTVGDAGAAGITALVTSDANPTAAGGYDDDKPKRPRKRFVVEQDGKLLVFSSARAAVQALGQQKALEAVAVQPAEEALEPEISLPAVQAYAEVRGLVEDYQAALRNRHYLALIAMFRDMRDEEDVELLLMHA